MKKIKLSIFIVVLGLLLVSCKRDITEPVISANPDKPAQSDLSITVDFVKANAESPITFSWSAANFGFASSTTYTLQFSSKSDFSADVVNFVSTQNLTTTSSVKLINNVLLGWNKTAGTATNLYYRVSASVAPTNVVYSDVKSKSLTPFKLQLDPSEYTIAYVPGSYQGWSPGAANGRLYSYNADSKYEGIIRLKNGADANVAFKITVKANWDGPNYGGTLTKTGTNYSGSLDAAGGDFSVAAGTYLFNVDITAKTISLTKTDDWGLIGDATPGGWGTSTPMFYDAKFKLWTITTNLTAGGYKFRANDAWSLNYGDDGSKAGKLKQDGDNISATAGNYTISFDPAALTYIVKKN